MTQERLDKVLKELDKRDIPYEVNMIDSETTEIKALLNNKFIRLGTNAIIELLGDEK